MTFNIDTCKIVIWGEKSIEEYTTHSHIHEAFYRTALHLDSRTRWFGQNDIEDGFDWANTLVITVQPVATQSTLPVRDDCFYAIHNLYENPEAKDRFCNVPVLDFVGVGINNPGLDVTSRTLRMYWATDLVPHEIQALKPDKLLSLGGNTIYYIGSQWFLNDKELMEFKRACDDTGISFEVLGAGRHRRVDAIKDDFRHQLWPGVVSIKANIRAIRQSYIAPIISGAEHINRYHYIPCRAFKNISYGQYPVTNSLAIHEFFGERTIYNPDPYKLLADAQNRLKSVSVEELHELMNFVAENHTYVNRIDAIKKAIGDLC
jgi:hypothetical protein